MDHWTENYCEEENNLLAYNRFMLDRLQQQQRQEGQRTHTNLANVIQSPHRTPHSTKSSYQSVEVLLSLFKKIAATAMVMQLMLFLLAHLRVH